MAGTYIEGTSKVLSGVYSRIKAALAAASVSSRGIVAYPFTANWGPTNTLTVVGSQDDFISYYNPVTGFTAKKINDLAYAGKPQRVLAYRMATNAAAKGTVTLKDSGNATSIQLETLYPSSRAFTANVKDGTSGGKIIEVLEGSLKLVSVESTTVAGLIDLLNSTDYVRVKASGSNMPVNVTGSAFAGGNDGSVATATEYANFLDELEADGTANSFTLDGVTDESLITTAVNFVTRVRDTGFYVKYVRGGVLAWDTDLTTANSTSKALNNKAIVNVGNGVDGYTGADMAIFIAARIASIALNRTLADEVTPFIKVNHKLKVGEREVAKQNGTLVFIQDGDSVVIDEGINTLTTPHADETVEMGKIRIMNALDQITKDLENFGNEYKKARSNTAEARETYAATVEETYLKSMVAMEVLQPGCYYRPDPNYHGKNAVYTAKIDEAFFTADITPVDSMERIYQAIGVHF